MPSPKIELPPMIAAQQERNRRNRVRLELSIDRAQWLLGIITVSMKGLDIDDPEFRDTYLLHKSLTDQISKGGKP